MVKACVLRLITDTLFGCILGDDGNSVGSVSRSGRVRKKNSLLAVYESPDVIEKRGRKPNTINRVRLNGMFNQQEIIC